MTLRSTDTKTFCGFTRSGPLLKAPWAANYQRRDQPTGQEIQTFAVPAVALPAWRPGLATGPASSDGAAGICAVQVDNLSKGEPANDHSTSRQDSQRGPVGAGRA